MLRTDIIQPLRGMRCDTCYNMADTGNTMLGAMPDPKGHISYDFYETSSTGKHVETHSRPVVAKSQEGGAGGQERIGESILTGTGFLLG